jgi:hypothetical protein
MGAINQIRRFVAQQPAGKPFSTRDLLTFGKRASIDQATYMMVRSGRLIRVARGVFIRNTGFSDVPSIIEIARVKGRAFGKQLVVHGYEAARALELVTKNLATTTFAAVGCTTSFGTIKGRVSLRGACVRDIALGDTKAGLVIRALKIFGRLFGRRSVTVQIFERALYRCIRSERLKIASLAAHMPAWMSDYFAPCSRRRQLAIVPAEVNWTLQERIDMGLLDPDGRPWRLDDLGEFDD